MNHLLPPDAKPRRYIVTVRGYGDYEVKALDRHKAKYAVAQQLINARRASNLEDCMELFERVKVHPDDAQKRGPKKGTPNPYFIRYPGELTKRNQAKRRIKPEDARLDPNRFKH